MDPRHHHRFGFSSARTSGLEGRGAGEALMAIDFLGDGIAAIAGALYEPAVFEGLE